MQLSEKSTSDRTVPAASLEGVPTEILLTITTSVRSLDELWSLLTVSPRTWRLFNSQPLHIFEGVLSGPQSIYPPRLQELVRAVALVRHRDMPFDSLEEFRTKFLKSVLYSPSARSKRLERLQDPECLVNARVSAQVLLSVVATSAHLVALSQSCLAAALARLRDPGFQPLHCDVEKPPYRPQYKKFTRRRIDGGIEPWDRTYPGHPVQVVDVGPPTWLEEMRALRAMWMIQLFRDMQSEALQENHAFPWPDADKAHLLDLELADLVVSTHPWEPNNAELTSASHYLEAIGGAEAEADQHHRLPRVSKAMMSRKWEASSPNGTWVEEVKAYLDAPVTVLEHHDVYYWAQTDVAFHWQPPALTPFRFISNDENSPIRGVSFDLFRPFGFAFWDSRRMYYLGLMHGSRQDRQYSTEFYWFAWESILPPDEVHAIKTELRRKAADNG